MSDAAIIDSGPGIVAQKSWKPLGFLPADMQRWAGWLAKGALAVFSHNLYDLSVLGHMMPAFPNILTEAGRNMIPAFIKDPVVFGFYGSKLGGELLNHAADVGNIRNKEKDSMGDYLKRKLIPGALYCALLGGIYGTAFPAALTSFIITTAITDIAYNVLGEKLLGLPHIKS